MRRTAFALTTLLTLFGGSALAEPGPRKAGPVAGGAKRLMYTTYFYTATEAIIHGYEDGTKVRIVSLGKRGTVFEGRVDRGETKLVRTGRGVFGFLSDKKAGILVGTPSSCTAVGYYVRDREGSFKSDHFYTALPSSLSGSGARVVVWAWEDTSITVTDLSADRAVARTEIAAGSHYTIPHRMLASMGSHVLEVTADRPEIMVQVYYDEGFFVPSRDGRAAGKIFYTYVGDITEGVNDLQLISYHGAAHVQVMDIESDRALWRGTVEKGGIHTLTLSKKYVKIVSDREISAAVAPYAHYGAGYAEHHFSMGAEGTGIEHELLITTPGELWVFSYFDGSAVEITNAKTGERIWAGTLGAGHVRGLTPGHGFFRVRSTKGVSVMGGSSACGAEYSPAAGMFAVDEALFEVIAEIKEVRRQRAAAQGRTITEAELQAPLSKEEMKRAKKAVRSRAPRAAPAMSEDEIQQRVDDMVVY